MHLPGFRKSNCTVGQIAHMRHAWIARRAIVPQAAGIARNPKSAPSSACPASTTGVSRSSPTLEADEVDALAAR